MNDEVLNIKLTESEINLITLLLEQAGSMEDENGQPAFELLHDIMEQTARQDDPEWDVDPTDLDGRTFSVAESDFIDHGIRAREQAKATSMAASRRTMRFTRSDTDETTSEIQNHDLWERSNDPTKW